MAIVCPNPSCGKPLERDRANQFPTRCPACGKALRMRPAPSSVRSKNPAGATANDRASPAEADEFSLFGGNIAPLSERIARQASEPGSGRASAIGLLAAAGVLAAAGIAVWLLRNGANVGPQVAAKSVAVFQNVGRNYEISVEADTWRPDDAKAKSLGADLAFRHTAAVAWLVVASAEPSGKLPEIGELASNAEQWLASGLTETEPAIRTALALANEPASQIALRGKSSDQAVERRAIAGFSEGIGYRLALWSEAALDERVVADFESAVGKFRKLTTRPNWREALRNPSNLAEFRSEKFPYLLRAQRDLWRAAPELPIASRFADLKMIDKSRHANVVVSPREVRNLDALREAYVERAAREFGSANVVVRTHERDLKIAGRKAQRVVLAIADPTGDFVLDTSLLEAGNFIYQIEGRAPADRFTQFEPIFRAIVHSFEVVESMASKDVTAKDASVAQSVDKPKAPAALPKNETPAAPVNKKSAVAKETDKAKKAGEKGDAKAKRKSLDDLD